MMYLLHELQYAKRQQSVPLAIVDLHLSEGVSQSDSQSDSQSVEKCFFLNSIATVLKRFRPIFKAYWP